jgi:replicative DNA helicase
MTAQQSDPLDIIFSPAQIARSGTAYIEERVQSQGDGVPFGVPSVDEKFLPMLPGELLTLIARPGHGKSANLMRWARHRARHLQVNQTVDRVVVYFTLEQSCEELYSFHVAAETGVPVDMMARGQLDEAQLELVRDYGVRRSAVPLWFMGHSIERRKKRPYIDLPSVSESLRRIENWEKDHQKRDLKIDMLFVDYLQRLPYGDAESKVIGIDHNLNTLKDIALAFACPVCVGVQARREVDDRDVAVPELNDGQWCSSIEQVSDKVFSCVRPIKYKRESEMFGKTIVEGRNQMLLVLLKQKMGDAPFTFWMTFDPRYNLLHEAEEKNYDLTHVKGWDV